jgi:ribonuclease PH
MEMKKVKKKFLYRVQLLACAMNAACAALVDAGIPLSGLIAAVSCGVTVNNELILDLLKSEEQVRPNSQLSVPCLKFLSHQHP